MDRSGSSPLWRRLAILAGATWLGWRVLSLGMADHLANSNPEAALAWRPDHPTALWRAAEKKSADPKARQRAIELARRAIQADPLQGSGYRVLAHLASSPEQALKLYRIAVERSPRDITSHIWLADHALRQSDYREVMAHVDPILRVEPVLLDRFYPVIERIALSPAGQAALADRLASRPPWRTALLARLARRTADVKQIAPLFERIRKQEGGLSEPELAAWLNRLIEERQWGSAYLTWAGQLPPEKQKVIGNVFDGGFEWLTSGTGFDWRVGQIPGARIDFTSTEGVGGNQALHVAFEYRRVRFNHVRQLLALPPGAYRFEGRTRLDGLENERGLKWSVSCADSGAPLGSSEPLMGRSPWRVFSFEWVVPQTGCDGQWLRLLLPARIAAEQRIGGEVWFDDFRLFGVAPPQ